MYGNASLSRYDPASGVAINDVFYNTNNFPLGDVLQSMSVIDGKSFLVVNNSGKVVVTDPLTSKYLGTIKGLNSPRHIEKVSENRLYISSLYSPSIAVVDPTTYQITSQIYVGGGTEQMVRVGDYLFACSWSMNNQIYRIDTRTDRLVDSLTVAQQPNSMVADKDNKLWVLSDGGYAGSPYGQYIAALTRIDAHSFEIEHRFDFADLQSSPSRLSINSTRDTLYYINGGYGSNKATSGLCRMAIKQPTLSLDAFIPEAGRLFYGVGIDPRTSEIYISDAIDYVQRGTVLRYSPHGELITQFKVGIIPNAFYFLSPSDIKH